MAVKKFEAALQEESQDEVAREALIMSSCNHPNIAQIYGEHGSRAPSHPSSPASLRPCSQSHRLSGYVTCCCCCPPSPLHSSYPKPQTRPAGLTRVILQPVVYLNLTATLPALHVSLFPRPNTMPPGLAREPGSGVVCCVMRYYSNGSLADLLSREQQRPQLSLTLKLQMALDIARGMAYLHARPNGQVSAGGTALVL